jgi:hypothetical protein
MAVHSNGGIASLCGYARSQQAFGCPPCPGLAANRREVHPGRWCSNDVQQRQGGERPRTASCRRHSRRSSSSEQCDEDDEWPARVIVRPFPEAVTAEMLHPCQVARQTASLLFRRSAELPVRCICRNLRVDGSPAQSPDPSSARADCLEPRDAALADHRWCRHEPLVGLRCEHITIGREFHS